MSVWPETLPGETLLAGSEGQLVSVSIRVDPRRLESLLDLLARVRFPINPQIFHDAAMIYHEASGAERIEPATLVEFPAYEAHLAEVRQALEGNGFPVEDLLVTGMLDDICSTRRKEPAPLGASYLWRSRVRRRPAASA